MKHPKNDRTRRDLCAQFDEDDGLDARKRDRQSRRASTSQTIADRRLCKVALIAVSHTLLELAHDPILCLLHVHEVTWDRGRMIVVLASSDPLPPHLQSGLLAAADAARAPMRAAVARAINRKRTPELLVEVAPVVATQQEPEHE